MVGFTFNNSTGAIDLFGKGETYHLVGKSHQRE